METKKKGKPIPITSGLQGIKSFAEGLEKNVKSKKEEGLSEVNFEEIEKEEEKGGEQKAEVKEKEKKKEINKEKIDKGKKNNFEELKEEIFLKERELDFSRLKMEQIRITTEQRDLLKLYSVLSKKNLTLVVWEAIEAYIITNDIKKLEQYGK